MLRSLIESLDGTNKFRLEEYVKGISQLTFLHLSITTDGTSSILQRGETKSFWSIRRIHSEGVIIQKWMTFEKINYPNGTIGRSDSHNIFLINDDDSMMIFMAPATGHTWAFVPKHFINCPPIKKYRSSGSLRSVGADGGEEGTE